MPLRLTDNGGALYPAVMVQTDDGWMDYGAAQRAGYVRDDDGIWRRGPGDEAPADAGDAEHTGDPRREANGAPLDWMPVAWDPAAADGDGPPVPVWAIALGVGGLIWWMSSS